MVRVLRLPQELTPIKERCCHAHCDKKLYYGRTIANRKLSNQVKGFRVGQLRSQKIWAFTGVLVEPNYGLCREHNSIHPRDMIFLTNFIVDVIYGNLSVNLKRVISNSRELLYQQYEKKKENKLQKKLIWSDMVNDKLIILCGLSAENLSEVSKKKIYVIFVKCCHCFWCVSQISNVTRIDEQHLFIFFTICRTGVSQRVASSIFGYSQSMYLNQK